MAAVGLASLPTTASPESVAMRITRPCGRASSWTAECTKTPGERNPILRRKMTAKGLAGSLKGLLHVMFCSILKKRVEEFPRNLIGA
mmetsp:Transcript_61919/g.135630  ORF Transcript_61919/g.135630 Transcript_61919/m.135630 type:complete len:87 (-) Transcript_61919:146-406(-)